MSIWMRAAATMVLAMVAVLMFAPPASAKRVALVIGINSYDNLKPELQLRKALNDSRAVSDAFKQVGYQVVQAANTSRNDFLRAWQRFLDQVQPGDETALYFAGHGFEINGNNYLLVRDAPEVADGEEVLKESAIRVGKLIDTLKDKQAQVSLYFLDACRDNPYGNIRSTRSLSSATRGLVREDAPKGTLVMMSAAAGQSALDALSDNDPDPNSVYTRTLVPLLKQPGLEIIDMAKKLRSDVEALAGTIHHDQRPAFYDELSGNYYLVPAPQSPQAAIASGPILSEAAQAWEVTKDTTSQAVLETYIRKFGLTFYGDMARARLDEIKQTQAARLSPPSTSPVLLPAPPSDTVVQPLDEAGRAWTGIQATKDTSVLESFLRQFGKSGYFAALARARLEQIKREKIEAALPASPAPRNDAAASPPKQNPPAASSAPPSAYEAAQAWTAVKNSNDAADLDRFIARYGQSIYADLARARLDELKKSAQVAVASRTVPPAASPTPPPPPVASAAPPSAYEAAQAWLAVKGTANAADLEAFIGRYGNSVYADMARARLNELKNTQQAVAAPVSPPPAARPDIAVAPPPPSAPSKPPSAYEAAQAWVAVKNSTNAADLEAFIARYGDSVYVDMARARLKVLKTAGQAAPVAPAAPLAPLRSTLAAVVPTAPLPAEALPLTSPQESALKPGDKFKDCAQCPQMVVVPPGQFTMGSPADEPDRSAEEGPPLRVTVAKPFAVGEFSVTYDEWDACVAAGGCNGYKPADQAGRRGRYPVVNVSWDDAKAYLAWLSQTTGKSYRLLSEAEREYVARAGTTTPFWFGSSISTKLANYDGDTAYAGGQKGEFRHHSLPVDIFDANPFGLYQTNGNVYDWVEDCWSTGYQGAPQDGAARVSGDCGRRVLRGGSWYDPPAKLRAANRAGFFPGYRSDKIGFRVARPL